VNSRGPKQAAAERHTTPAGLQIADRCRSSAVSGHTRTMSTTVRQHQLYQNSAAIVVANLNGHRSRRLTTNQAYSKQRHLTVVSRYQSTQEDAQLTDADWQRGSRPCSVIHIGIQLPSHCSLLALLTKRTVSIMDEN